MSQLTAAPLSAGAKFRAALAAEKPLQVVGAINAYAARMAEATGFRALYLSGGGVAANSLGLPDLGISTMDDVLIDIRRITEASTLPLLVDADTGWGGAFNIARTVQLLHQGRRGGPAHRRPGAGQALRPSSRQGSRARRTRWSIASRPRSTRAPTRASSSWRAATRWRAKASTG